jgi:hypothetical protein
MKITSRIKMNALCLLLSLCLTSAVTASQSPGFSQGDLAQAARVLDAAAQRTDAVRRITAQTEILRAVLANDLPNAQRRISRDELQVLTIALGAPTVTRDIMLSWLMRSGVTLAADGEISGIYSPLADAWLVLHWAQLGGSPRLIDAALVRGTSLRPAETQPDWLSSEAPFAAALLRTKLQAEDSFAALSTGSGVPRLFASLGVTRDVERAAVFQRSAAMLGAVSAWSRSNGGRLAALDRVTRKRPDPVLRALPDRVREQLSPMAVLNSPQGTLLVLLSPVYPTRVVIATFTDIGEAPALSLMDLSPTPAWSAAR